MRTMADRVIEFPAVHNTYTEEAYGVFEYDTYPEHSVLAGQERRRCLGSFATRKAAEQEFPGVRYVEGSGFVDRPIPETPPEWFREDDIGERWLDD